ncbi:reverse transcriptase domain-containing protein [Tanacetum coccineum]
MLRRSCQREKFGHKGFEIKEENDTDKMITMEKKLKFLNEIVYKLTQSIQTIHMLAPKGSTYNGRPTFANPIYLKKAQSEKPCLYEIPYVKSYLANMFAPNREETLTLKQESRSKFNKDLVKPYDYTKQNITLHSWRQVRKSSFAKPYDVNAPGPSRNSLKHVSFQSPKEFVGSNDMVHNYYLEDAKKKAQIQKDKALNTKSKVQGFENKAKAVIFRLAYLWDYPCQRHVDATWAHVDDTWLPRGYHVSDDVACGCTRYEVCRPRQSLVQRYEAQLIRGSGNDEVRDPERLIRRINHVEPSLLFDFEEIDMNNNNNETQGPPPVSPISYPDLRTMDELLQAPTEGVGDAIIVHPVLANQFELKIRLLNLIDAFYNGLNQSNQDSLNSAAGGNLLTRNNQEALTIIENKSKHIYAKQKMVDSIQESCETCGGLHHYSECQATDGFTQGSVYAATGNYNAGGNSYQPQGNPLKERPQGMLPSNTIPSHTIPSPQEDIKVITTRSGMNLTRPSVPPPTSSSSPSKEVERDSETTMDQKLHFNISFAEALAHMPKYAKMLKDLLTNKEKLLELANTLLNENCSTILLKRFPEKHRDPGKFLIPCDFSELEECLALADLGASINLMPLSVWKNLLLPELTPTRMTLELANRLVSYPVGIGKDVFVQVGKFTFLADFIVVDYDVDPRIPLNLWRTFLRTSRALVDVYRKELTLRFGDEELVFNVESTSKYPHKHGDESISKIDIIDITYEDHFHEVLNVQKSIHPLSGSPTPSSDPVVASLSLSLIPFGDSDFLLEGTDPLLALDDLILPKIDDGIFDLEGDTSLLEKLLNIDSIKDLLPKELKNDETKMTKSSIEEPPELELKDLPPYLEYAFLEGTSKLPVIIAKYLKREERDHLIKILMEDDFKPVVQHQRRVNPKIHEVIRVEVIKLLDTGLIYPISNSPWLSPVHVVPKKGEKCYFMVKEGIILSHKISKNGIEVDHAKVDVIAKLPPRTTLKGTRKCMESFEILKNKLTEAPFLMAPDWDLPFEIMCDASDFATHYTTTEKELLAVVYAFEKFLSYLVLSKTIVLISRFTIKKGAENLAADHLSRLENPYKEDLVEYDHS